MLCPGYSCKIRYFKASSQEICWLHSAGLVRLFSELIDHLVETHGGGSKCPPVLRADRPSGGDARRRLERPAWKIRVHCSVCLCNDGRPTWKEGRLRQHSLSQEGALLPQ